MHLFIHHLLKMQSLLSWCVPDIMLGVKGGNRDLTGSHLEALPLPMWVNETSSEMVTMWQSDAHRCTEKRTPWRRMFMVSPESKQVFLGKEMCAHTSEDLDQLVEAIVCNNPKLEMSQMSSYRRRVFIQGTTVQIREQMDPRNAQPYEWTSHMMLPKENEHRIILVPWSSTTGKTKP